MKPIIIGTSEDGDVKIDLAKLLATRAFLQANSGGGKSWAMRRIAEQTIPQVQTVIVDPEGEFSTLRQKHDLLLIGSDGEAAADPRSAGILALKLAELGVSAVLDIYDLKPHDRELFVRDFFIALLDMPKKLWHPMIIMVDEAQRFCPEKGVADSASTDAMINLLCQGRKRGICTIPATQRLSKLNKNAEAECNNVLIGRTVQDVDQDRAAKVLGFRRGDQLQLRELPPGEFFGFGPAIRATGIVKFKVGDVETTHPEPGHKNRITAPKASEAIKQLLPHLADLPEKAQEEARTLAEAKRQIADLTRQLKVAGRSAPAAGKPQNVEVSSKRDQVAIQKLRKGLEEAMKTINIIAAATPAAPAVDVEQIRKIVEGAVNQIVRVVQTPAEKRAAEFEKIKRQASAAVAQLSKLLDSSTSTAAPSLEAPPQVAQSLPIQRKPAAPDAGDGSLTRAESLMLAAIVQRQPCTRISVSIRSGYVIGSGSFNNALSGLRSKGLIMPSGELVPTAEGNTKAAEFPQLPSCRDSLHMWIQKLTKAEGMFLNAMFEAYPEPLTRERLGEITSYAVGSGSFNNALSGLRSKEFITRDASPRAADEWHED